MGPPVLRPVVDKAGRRHGRSDAQPQDKAFLAAGVKVAAALKMIKAQGESLLVSYAFWP